MDLSTNSIGWHRTRKWLDDEIERHSKERNTVAKNPEQFGGDWSIGFHDGMVMAYMKMKPRFYTTEENAAAEKTRREMFG